MPRLIFIFLFAAASALPAADAKKITYQDHVRPVFANRCLNCHNPDKAKGGLDLSTFTNTMAGGSSGEIVNAGSANDSRLYKSVAHLEDPKMPPEGDKLPKAELDLIAGWINGGLLETSSSTARKPKKPAFDLAVKSSGPGKPEGPPPMPEHLLLDPPTVTARASAQADIASSPWAPLVALTGQKQVLLYNTDSHQLAGVLPFPEGFPEHLSFSRNGTLLLAAGGRGGKSGRVVVWDVKTGKRVSEIGNEFDTVLAADITSDNALVALGGPSRRIKIYNTSDGSELISIKKHTDWVTALSFSPDGDPPRHRRPQRRAVRLGGRHRQPLLHPQGAQQGDHQHHLARRLEHRCQRVRGRLDPPLGDERRQAGQELDRPRRRRHRPRLHPRRPPRLGRPRPAGQGLGSERRCEGDRQRIRRYPARRCFQPRRQEIYHRRLGR